MQKIENTALSDLQLLRLPIVLGLVGLKRTAWFSGVKDGRYPAPVRIGKRSIAWRSSDIAELINSFGDA